MTKYFFLFAFLLSAGTLAAQFTLRPQVGINFSSFTNNLPEAALDGKTGIQFGIDAQFGNRFYVQPGLFYEGRNSAVDPEDQNTPKLDVKVNRVRIPALIGYNLFGEPEQLLNLRVFTGPDISFAISKNVDESQFAFDKDDIKNFVWGWSAGAGVDIAFLFVDLSYEFGLSEVFKNLESNPKNNLFYLNAGINLRF